MRRGYGSLMMCPSLVMYDGGQVFGRHSANHEFKAPTPVPKLGIGGGSTYEWVSVRSDG
jgi:hypothetical protein